MNRTTLCIAVLATCALGTEATLAVTREIADLQETAPLTLRQSVISQLSAGILKDPYDEFLFRPYNLDYVNLERLPNLSPWPGQQGEQKRYVDFLIGNNGNSDVRDGSDTLQGTYIGQPGGRFSWGVSAAYLGNEFENSNDAAGATFSDGGELTAGDLRFGMSYRISNRIVLGGGAGMSSAVDRFEDSSATPGGGGFLALQETTQTGFEADFGLRWFTGEARSWEIKLLAGLGDTSVDDHSDLLDATGAVTERFVVTDYDISDTQLEASAGYNRRFVESQGEMQVRLGIRMRRQELDNSVLSSLDLGAGAAPTLLLLGQDPITSNTLFVSADTLFVRGWTQIFGSARVAYSSSDGSTEVDSLGTIVNESIDDTRAGLGLVMGLRQPLWNEKFRLVARASGDWFTESTETAFDDSATRSETTQTTTRYAIGIETVLNNMVFDLAWLFGGDPAPGAANETSRQTIDLDRLVISATFGW